ncbi:hypothetical protein [Sinorhizobium meliloti]|uniref:hypothetical protein n=1 Tax=Rhizobium meliloti TaxID=382 RepID=UPI0018956268|nr:hypothetical protein [Sinorhizobium meliloti]
MIHPRLSRDLGSYPSVAREVIRLLDYGFLIVAGTALGDRNDKYDREWRWGETAGLFHFSIKYTQYIDAGSSIAAMTERC